MLRTLIKLGLRDEKRFLRLLAKLEYGVSIFCSKLSAIAELEEKHHLATQLDKHARQEKHHGLMLASLTDGKEHIAPLKHAPGAWQDGHFENFDGLSRRYLSLRLLFGDRHAIDFDWADRIAFMAVLEEETAGVYKILQTIGTEPLRAIANQIASDELSHSEYLRYTLWQFSPMPAADIEKWRKRLFWAKYGLIVDMWSFINGRDTK